VFRIDMLPAQQGDSLWIEYGEASAPHRILIDCGTPPTAKTIVGRIEQLPPEQQRFELLVITHMDTDHIGGALRMLAERPPALKFNDVWFNAWRHLQLKADSTLGPIDGEILSRALDKLGWSWNAAFRGGAVCLPDDGEQLQSCHLPGGLRLTVLSPGRAQLQSLRREWIKVVRQAGLDPDNPVRDSQLLKAAAGKGVSKSILGGGGPDIQYLAGRPFVPDTAVANGSTIALLAEYAGRSILLLGDGFPEVVLGGIRQLLRGRGASKLHVDAVKVAHHGSQHNTSNDLLDVLISSCYLISTNGAIFSHPDDVAMARIVWANRGKGTRLLFNYPKHDTWSGARWSDPRLQDTYHYQTSYGADWGASLVLEP
jgi:beta-lactamase superfamily II metal-dependent hydrolase